MDHLVVLSVLNQLVQDVHDVLQVFSVSATRLQLLSCIDDIDRAASPAPASASSQSRSSTSRPPEVRRELPVRNKVQKPAAPANACLAQEKTSLESSIAAISQGGSRDVLPYIVPEAVHLSDLDSSRRITPLRIRRSQSGDFMKIGTPAAESSTPAAESSTTGTPAAESSTAGTPAAEPSAPAAQSSASAAESSTGGLESLPPRRRRSVRAHSPDHPLASCASTSDSAPSTSFNDTQRPRHQPKRGRSGHSAEDEQLSLEVRQAEIHVTAAIAADKVEKLRKLILTELPGLKESYQINRLTHEGEMPVHLAAAARANACLEELLINGSHVEPVNLNGMRPLHLACSANDRAGVRLLLEFGASPSRPSESGALPVNLTTDPGVKVLLTAATRLSLYGETICTIPPTVYTLCSAAMRKLDDEPVVLLSDVDQERLPISASVRTLHVALFFKQLASPALRQEFESFASHSDVSTVSFTPYTREVREALGITLRLGLTSAEEESLAPPSALDYPPQLQLQGPAPVIEDDDDDIFAGLEVLEIASLPK